MGKRYKGIVKEVNNTWTIHTSTILPDGTIKYIKKRGFKTQYEANIEKVRIISKLNNKSFIMSSNEVTEAVNDYFIYLSNTVKVTTLTSKESLFKKYVLNPFGELKISQLVEKNSLIAFVEHLNSLEISLRHKNRVISDYKSFLDYLYNLGKIDLDSFKNSNLIIKSIYDHLPKRIEERQIWSIEDFKTFLNGIPTDTQDFVIFSLWGHTGLRIGEIRALQVRHFNYMSKKLKIEQQASEKTKSGHTVIISPKTKSSIRTIALSDYISNMLNYYISVLELSQEDFLFHLSNPMIPIAENTLRRRMNMYCKKTNVPYIRPHGIRHSNTTWLLSGELSLQQIGIVSERLGHTDKTTTLNIYYHINKKDQSELLELLNFQ